MHCLYGGYNLHRFSDALGLVITFTIASCITFKNKKKLIILIQTREFKSVIFNILYNYFEQDNTIRYSTTLFW